jgi:hypothetical protein
MLHSSKSWAERPCRAVAATDSTQSGEKWDYTILHLKTVLGLGDCASYTSAHRPLARFSGMSEMKLAATIPVRADARAAMLCLLLVSACGTQGVRLSDTDRASLDNQPATQVLHYATPLPRIKAGNKSPAPADVRRHAAADPAALIAQGFSRLLGKKKRFKNLRVESQPLPLPVPNETTRYREKYRRGLVLELWVEEWSFSPLPADTKTYWMTLNARSRLARVEDGRVLWSSGRCSLGGNNASNRELRLAGAELTGGTKLRKLLVMARDECVRQLMRDFDARGSDGRK